MAAIASVKMSGLLEFNKDIKSLREKLATVRAILANAGAQQASSSFDGVWLKKLQTAIMDAEHVIDEVNYELLNRKIQQRDLEENKVRNFFSVMYSTVKCFLKVKDSNRKLERIFQKSKKLGLDKTEVVSRNWELENERKEALVNVELEIMVRGRAMSEIVRALLSPDQEEDFSVVGITGPGGIGKTTLAQEVFKCDKVAKHFDTKMWITASDGFDANNLREEMIRSFNPIYHLESKGEAIMEKLQRDLSGKRFLLVLDDIRNEDQGEWDGMSKFLLKVGVSKGSKILVTSRKSEVLRATRASFLYDLEPLSDDDSWKLFARIAFADGGKEKHSELVDIGKRLVKRCDGLPLTIKVLAGLLYSKESKHEWTMIETSETWSENFAALQLSYDSLPSLSLKECFAYCSIFPKSTVIEREKIIQQWMAQGFLNSSEEFHLEMEDRGNYYFRILLQNSFFQEAEKDDYDNIISFKMHDIVHDFALYIASNSCLTLTAGVDTAKDDAIHLSVISEEGNSCKIPEGKFQNLRTLYLVGGVLDDKLTSLIHVRVLVVESSEVRELPSSIGKLRNLRYLDISRTKITRLPYSITKLHNLQTLRLYALEEFPKKFNHLINLRHLHIEIISDDLLIPGIRDLISLQKLPYFLVSRDMGFQIEELGCLPNLKGNLKIFGLQRIEHRKEAMKANLSEKSHIQSLEFHWDDVAEQSNDMDVLDGLKPHSNLKGLTIVNFQGSTFPSWMVQCDHSLFCNLVHFRLENCNKCDEVPAIGHLPSLKIVEIYKMNNVKAIGPSFYGWKYRNTASSVGDTSTSFPSLRRLSLSGMPSLENWSGAGHPSIPIVCPKMEELTIGGCLSLVHLPEMSKLGCLRRLVISSCEKLASLPEGIGSLASLEYLGISKCANLALLPDARGLVSLRFLSIVDCKMLRALPHSLEQCSLLESLSVLSCPALRPEALRCLRALRKMEIGYFADELGYFPWPNADVGASSSKNGGYIQHHCEFLSLTSLKLYGWPKLSSLPEQLQYLSALRDLTICLFDGLVLLPDWLCNVQTLEILELQECSKLNSFPSLEAMKCLTKLQSLKILYCPLLEEKCKEGSGSEWQKIAHVPQIYINNKLAQSQRRTLPQQEFEITEKAGYSSSSAFQCGSSVLLFISSCIFQLYKPRVQ